MSFSSLSLGILRLPDSLQKNDEVASSLRPSPITSVLTCLDHSPPLPLTAMLLPLPPPGEIMLFGVRVVDSMRKSVSMNNLCNTSILKMARITIRNEISRSVVSSIFGLRFLFLIMV